MKSCNFLINSFLLMLPLLSATGQPVPMIRIAVENTGMHIIPSAELKQCGLNDIERVSIYGRGGCDQLSDEIDDNPLPEIPSMATPGGDIIFYAEGPERYHIKANGAESQIYTLIECNASTTRGYYFLALNDTPLRIHSPNNHADTHRKLTDHFSAAVYHPRLTNPARGGAYFLGEDFSINPDKTLTIRLSTPDITDNSRLWLRMRGAVKSTIPRINYTFNSSSKILPCVSSQPSYNDIEKYFSPTNTVQTAFAQTDGHPSTQVLTFSSAGSGTTSYAAIESATLTYRRHNKMPDDGSQLSMYLWKAEAGDMLIFNPVPFEVSVWDVSNPVRPVNLPTTYDRTTGTSAAQITSTHEGCASFIAFSTDATQLPRPTILGPASPGLLHDMEVPDYVIVTAPRFTDQAHRLADLHARYSNLEVTVVPVSQVFDDFSSGAPSPFAIQRFVKSLDNRNHGKLKHLLLFGASTWDPCMRLTGVEEDDTNIITYQTEDFLNQSDAALCYASDAFFGVTHPSTGQPLSPDMLMRAPMTVNIGRIPSLTSSQATQYVDKVERYLTNAFPDVIIPRSHALVIGDHGDDNLHLLQAMELADSIEYRWAHDVIATRALSALYERRNGSSPLLLDKVIQAFSNGVGYVAYSGHGNTQNLTSDETLTATAMSRLKNRVYPLITLSTCYATGFDRRENTVGERLLFNPQGGGIVVIGSSRAVKASLNQTLNIAIGREFHTAAAGSTMGDIYRRARNRILSENTNSDLTINTASYNMLGDPALPLRLPTHNISLDKLPDSQITVNTLTDNHITGTITRADGTVDSDFNGKIAAMLYEPSATDMSSYDPKGCPPVQVVHRNRLVTTTTATVEHGQFAIDLGCPEVRHTGDNHTLTLHAVSNDRLSCATMLADNIRVNQHNASIEANPPIIHELYIDTPDFTNGGIVPADIAVKAVIENSPYGLSQINTLGRSCYLSIDGTRHHDIIRHISTSTTDHDMLTMDYRVNSLSDGRHTATLFLSDNAGYHASQTIMFQVINDKDPLTLTIVEETADTRATINLTHDLDSQPSGRLVIDNSQRKTILSVADVSFPYIWDLRDSSGIPVPDGRYTVRAYLRDGQRPLNASPATVVVIKVSVDQ